MANSKRPRAALRALVVVSFLVAGCGGSASHFDIVELHLLAEDMVAFKHEALMAGCPRACFSASQACVVHEQICQAAQEADTVGAWEHCGTASRACNNAQVVAEVRCACNNGSNPRDVGGALARHPGARTAKLRRPPAYIR